MGLTTVALKMPTIRTTGAELRLDGIDMTEIMTCFI